MTRVPFLVLWWLLWAWSAAAQVSGLPTRAGGASSVDCSAVDGGICQTNAAMTLYVDPTGSDSNACTASGTAACATLQGAFDKLPDGIRHTVTINMAAGTYTADATLSQKTFQASSSTAGNSVGVFVTGASLQNVTPVSGSATGTLSGTGSGNNPLPIFTVAGAGWTTNDFRGAFLVMTSGTQSGSRMPIVANDATTLTTLPWSAYPSAGDTFAIQIPSTVLNGLTAVNAIRGNMGVVRFTNVTLTSSTSTTATLSAYQATPALQLATVRVIKTTTAGAALSATRGALWAGGSLQSSTLAPSVAMSIGTGVAYAASAPSTSGVFSGQLMLYAASAAALALSYVGAETHITAMRLSAETGGATNTAISILGAVGWSNSGLTTSTMHARCPAGSTGIGVELVGSSTAQYNIEVVNCGTGVQLGSAFTNAYVNQPSFLNVTSSLRCTNTTTCLDVRSGGRANIRTAPTFTGVTTEYTLDGTSYTEAFFAALPTTRITSPLQSVLERY